MMESATAAVRGAPGAPLVYPGRARRVVVGPGAGRLAAAPVRRRRGALVAVASLHEPVPSSRAPQEEDPVAVVPPQADEEGVHGNGSAAAETSYQQPVVSGKTVRVRFVLEKQDALDQSVYLVGDVPVLGLWDPANAIPLECTESHDWILEKDLPANKLIEFKFLLRDSSGKLHWQNGPNRIFQTGETTNTLVVFEDWGDVKNQRVAEEEKVMFKKEEMEEVASVQVEEEVFSDDSEIRKSVALEDELQMDDNQEVKEDEPTVVVEEDEESAVSTNASVQMDSLKTDSLKTNETSPQESMLPKELETVDELDESVAMESVSALFADESSAEKNGEDDILHEDGVPVENGMAGGYEHDLLWGWKAVQQLMMNLGIKMDTDTT